MMKVSNYAHLFGLTNSAFISEQLTITYIYNIICLLVMITINVFLVIGVHKRQISFINVWLILFAIFIVPFQMFATYSLMNTFGNPSSRQIFNNLIIVILLCELTFYVYSWLSIYSLRRIIQLGKPISLNWETYLKREEEEIPVQLQPKRGRVNTSV